MSRPDTGLHRWWGESPLADMRQEMDQLLTRFFGEEAGLPNRGIMSPSLDLLETDSEIEVRLDLPGFKPDEIDVDLSRDILTISGDHKEEKEEKEDGRRYHRIERRSGSFRRTVQLPASVQEDKIDANFKDGVLTVKLPKAEDPVSELRGKSHFVERAMMDHMMDGMMGWGWLMMLLVIVLLVSLIVLVVLAIIRISRRPK